MIGGGGWVLDAAAGNFGGAGKEEQRESLQMWQLEKKGGR
jgi:hypothetical protein